MKFRRIALALLTTLTGFTAAAEQRTDAYNVEFVVNSTKLSPDFSNNRQVLGDLDRFLSEVKSNDSIRVLEITYCGYASPEGPTSVNERLSRGRCSALANYVSSRATFPDATITEGADIDIWPEVVRQLRNSNYEYLDEVTEILDNDSYETSRNNPYRQRVAKLKKLRRGTVWAYIDKNILTPMRNATVTFVTFVKEAPRPVLVEKEEPAPYIEEVVEEVVEEVQEDVWQPHVYLKTNAVGWAMFIANAAAEFEFHPHWSVSLPLYFGAMNYFTRTVKFRTLAFQPEIRYWFRPNNKPGMFIGAHFGVAKYNFAIDGKYRFQDHQAKYPALGGGLSLGYRLPLTKDQRWKLEFTAGGGYYHIWTDYFKNEANGPRLFNKKKNVFIVDNVGVTFMYMFDL